MSLELITYQRLIAIQLCGENQQSEEDPSYV